MKPENAKTYPIYTCLSMTALEMAAEKIGPSKTYTLYVGSKEFLQAKRLLRDLNMQVRDNILASYVNLDVDLEYDTYEWSLHNNSECFWRPGC